MLGCRVLFGPIRAREPPKSPAAGVPGGPMLGIPKKACSRPLVRGHLEILNLALVAVPNTSCMLPDHMLWTMRADDGRPRQHDRSHRRRLWTSQ